MGRSKKSASENSQSPDKRKKKKSFIMIDKTKIDQSGNQFLGPSEAQEWDSILEKIGETDLNDFKFDYDLVDNWLSDLQSDQDFKFDPIDLSEFLSSVWQKHGGKSYQLNWNRDGKISISLDDFTRLEIHKTKSGLQVNFLKKKNKSETPLKG